MARLLITQTLLSAWGHAHDCWESCAEDAYISFLDTLNRVQREPSEEMQRGIAFENAVYHVLDGHPADGYVWENGIQAVSDVLRGAAVQVRVQREMSLDGREFLVYGVLDALKAGTIYDVKFSNTNFASAELAGKYFGSAQHPAYLYMVPEAREFVYLVSDGEDLYTERYTRKETRPLEEIVREFMDSLEVMGLLDVYARNWAAR